MQEMIKMVIVLTLLSSLSGGLLAAVRESTKARIEDQQLQFVKGPALKSIFEDASNDPIADRFKLKDGEVERTFFVGVKEGAVEAIAFECFGVGFGGDVGLMVAVNLADDTIKGVGVTTHSETPGLGARAKEDTGFTDQFGGADIQKGVKVISDGGEINALSGATITSRAVCMAATRAGEIYKRLKSQLVEQSKRFAQ